MEDDSFPLLQNTQFDISRTNPKKVSVLMMIMMIMSMEWDWWSATSVPWHTHVPLHGVRCATNFYYKLYLNIRTFAVYYISYYIITCTLWRYGPWRTLTSLKTDLHPSLLRTFPLPPLILIFLRSSSTSSWAYQHSFLLQVCSYTILLNLKYLFASICAFYMYAAGYQLYQHPYFY
jgi:hypothetical protein